MTVLGDVTYVATKAVKRRLLAFDLSRQPSPQVGEWELEVDRLSNDGLSVYGFSQTLFRLDFLPQE